MMHDVKSLREGTPKPQKPQYGLGLTEVSTPIGGDGASLVGANSYVRTLMVFLLENQPSAGRGARVDVTF